MTKGKIIYVSDTTFSPRAIVAAFIDHVFRFASEYTKLFHV